MKKLLILPLSLMLLSGAFTSCKKDAPITDQSGKEIVDPEQKIKDQEKELEELRALAEMDRREMENQYEQFALQYDELKKGVKDEKIVKKLDEEKKRTKELLEQIKKLNKQKHADASEILRLKQELESVRAVLRSYIAQVDSLSRENRHLRGERDQARLQLSDANVRISDLNTEKQRLNDKVERAAQLNASGISINAVKKNGKGAKKTKEISRFNVSFNLQRNVTAKTGERRVYVRFMGPSGSVLSPSGKFNYENRSLDYSASKSVEYTGEEQHISLVIPASNDFLQPGRYPVHIFCDGQAIGSSSITIEK